MAFLESLFGSPGRVEQVSRFTPQQQALQDQMISALGPLLQQLQQPANIDPILQQRKESFQTETIPGLAERFTGMGGSAQRSSAFQGALGSAGAGLEKDLAALQAQTQLSDLGRLQQLFGGLSQGAFQPSFERDYVPGSQGAIPGLLAPIAQGLGAGIGGFAASGGNPIMALLSLLGGRGV